MVNVKLLTRGSWRGNVASLFEKQHGNNTMNEYGRGYASDWLTDFYRRADAADYVVFWLAETVKAENPEWGAAFFVKHETDQLEQTS